MCTVIKNRNFSSAFRSELAAFVAIFNGYGKPGLCCTKPGTGNADATSYQCSQHGKKSPVVAGNRTFKFALLVHAGKFVQHIFLWYSYLFKIDNAVVNAIQAHLSSTILNGHSRQCFSSVIAKGHKKRTYSVVFAIQHQLGEDRCHVTVNGCI